MDKSFKIDSKEDIAYLFLSVIVLFLFLSFTSLDGHLRAMFRENVGYFTAPENGLVFTKEQIKNMNWGSSTSLGVNSVGEERLYCFSVVDNKVKNLRFADILKDSDQTSVSGACYDKYGKIDGFVHTHPDNIRKLSKEDKKFEGTIKYTCVQYDEIVANMDGKLFGLDCYNKDLEEEEVLIT